MLESKGTKPQGDTLVDGTLVEVPRQHNTKEDNEQIKNGEVPKSFAANKRRDWYSGKKKRHSIKPQIVMNLRTLLIYCVHQDKGTVHDFKLCRQTILKLLIVGVMLYADSGYQGVQKVHANSMIPIKKKPNKELSAEEKSFNHALSSKRAAVEHMNAKIKTFKIMAHP